MNGFILKKHMDQVLYEISFLSTKRQKIHDDLIFVLFFYLRSITQFPFK